MEGTTGLSQLVPAEPRRRLDSEDAGLGREEHTLDKWEFIDVRALFWDTGLNTLVKTPRKWYKHAARMALRSMERVLTYTNWSRNDRIAVADGGRRNEKAQRSGPMRLDILCKGQNPARWLWSMKGPGGHTIDQSNKECVGERAPATLRSSVVLVFCIPGLTAGDAVTELGSQMMPGIKGTPNRRGHWQCVAVRSQVETIIVMSIKFGWHLWGPGP